MTSETHHPTTSAATSTGLTPMTTSPPAPSSATDNKSTSSKPSRRRHSASVSPGNKDASSKFKEQSGQRKPRPMAYRGGDGSTRGSVMTMPGELGAGDITYTPTTHRISKAKKGKKVHACEYPGCAKIFTRAEHRKRHEANHNTSPAFQCHMEGCKKPFQRADLLSRHMERQHNMPAEGPSARSPYSRGSMSEASASPSRGSIGAPYMGQPAPTPIAPAQPQPAGTMSIGSIIEHNRHSEYRTHSVPNPHHDLAQTPTGTAPRSLPPELLYGFSSSGDSPLYSSSDSCYSPISDYLQSQNAPHQAFYPQDIVSRPHSTSMETCFQPMVQSVPSPMSVGTPAPAWSTFEPSSLGFVSDAQCLPPHRQYQFAPPAWTGVNTVPQYEMALPPQHSWQFTKVNY